jgi:plasmid stability protein
MQYTLRNIPKRIDQALRQRARAENKSLNQVAIEALARALGMTREEVRHRDLSDLAGTWLEDPDFDEAVAEQEVIDEEMWQ